MIRRFAIVALALGAFSGQAAMAHGKANHCRNEKGQFTKCPKTEKAKPCRDNKGRFTKCDKKTADTESKKTANTATNMNSDMTSKTAPAAPANSAAH